MSDGAHMYPPYLTVPAWRQLRERGPVSADTLLSMFNIRGPPVNVEEVARRLGVHVHYVPHPGWLGAVSSTDSHAEVWLSTDQSAVRQRFTLAHELGHLLLHDLGVAYRDIDYYPGSNPIETEANRFAANLLMPTWMMRGAMHATGGDVRQMARLFDVSEQAMGFRLHNLGLR